MGGVATDGELTRGKRKGILFKRRKEGGRMFEGKTYNVSRKGHGANKDIGSV